MLSCSLLGFHMQNKPVISEDVLTMMLLGMFLFRRKIYGISWTDKTVQDEPAAYSKFSDVKIITDLLGSQVLYDVVLSTFITTEEDTL